MFKKMCLWGLCLSLQIPTLFSQDFSNWQVFTSVNSVKDLDFKNGKWFAATDGGLVTENGNSVEIISKNDGLTELDLTAVSIDSEGKTWLGFQESGKIKIWDSASGTIQSFADFGGSEVIQIDAKSDTVIAATLNQINIISRTDLKVLESIQNFGTAIGTEPQIYSFYKDGDILLVGTEKGLAITLLTVPNIQDPNNWTSFLLPTANDIFSITKNFDSVSNKNKYFLHTESGIFKISFQLTLDTHLSVTQLEIEEINSPSGNINSLKVINSELYSCTSAGIFKFDGNNWTQIMGGENLPNPIDLVQLENGDFLVGTEKEGFFRFETEWSEIALNVPVTNFFDKIAVDTKGKLWVLTGRSPEKPISFGVMTYENGIWNHLNTANTPEIISNSHFEIFADSKNNIWLGNPGKGVVRVQQNEATKDTYTHFYTDILSGAFLNSGDTTFVIVQGIAEDPRGNIWLSNKLVPETKDVVVVVKNDTTKTKLGGMKVAPFPTLSNLEGLYTTSIEEIRFDFQGHAWVTSFTNDFDYPIVQVEHNYTFDDQSDDFYYTISKTNNGLENSKVRDFEIDQNGEGWVGTPDGAYRLNTSANSPFVERIFGLPGNRILSDNIFCVEVDPTGKVWFGTDRGISVLNPGTYDFIENYSTSNSPLPENAINDIKFFTPEGEDTKAFIATNSGLAILSTGKFPTPDELSEIDIFPNPARIAPSKSNSITIRPAPSNSEVKIYTSSGRFVRSLEAPSGGGNIVWDSKNADGKLVATGVYVVILYDNGFQESSAVSKVAIIRE
ncbi:MAG: T9SS C-terminal target domain-containing protein [Calditrichaeota bacterium]|nr:MAG: T9SS C-terminal target domain-containing protein [Calditrichota bacterium]